METESTNPYRDLRRLARDVWHKLESVSPAAVAELASKIRTHRMGRTAQHYAAHYLLQEQLRMSRHRPAAERQADAEDDAQAELETDDAEALVRWRVGAWPLRSGRPLHDSPETDVREQIELHRANERGNRMAAQFLERVLEERQKRRLRPEDPCSKGLTEDDFDRLYREVYGEEAA